MCLCLKFTFTKQRTTIYTRENYKTCNLDKCFYELVIVCITMVNHWYVINSVLISQFKIHAKYKTFAITWTKLLFWCSPCSRRFCRIRSVYYICNDSFLFQFFDCTYFQITFYAHILFDRYSILPNKRRSIYILFALLNNLSCTFNILFINFQVFKIILNSHQRITINYALIIVIFTIKIYTIT